MVKGTGGGILPIDHVPNPYRFHQALMDILARAQKSETAEVGEVSGKSD